MTSENEKWISNNNYSQNVIKWYVGSYTAVFCDEVDVLFAADTSVKPED